MKKYCAIAAMLAFSSLNLLLAQPGTLDPGFSGDGKQYLNWGTAGWGAATSIAVHPDGKIIVAGVGLGLNNDNDFALARLLDNGEIDASFGNNGTVQLNLGSQGEWITDLAVLPDGKIIAIGPSQMLSNQQPAIALVRFLPNGELDPSFGNQGVTRTLVQQVDGGLKLAFQSDGKIIVMSNFSSANGFEFFRFSPDGILDNTFGQNGRFTHHLGYYRAEINAIALLPDGDIAATGYILATSTSGEYRYFLSRYHADGGLDSDFGTNGVVEDVFVAGIPSCYGTAVQVQADGKILLGGDQIIGNSYGLGLARYLPGGDLDQTFGANGKVVTEIPERSSSLRHIMLQSDGKIIATGNSKKLHQPFDVSTARYKSDGSIDSSFATNGFQFINYMPEAFISSDWDAALQPDGRMVGVVSLGYFDAPGPPMSVFRCLTDLNVGVLNANSWDASVLLYPNPIVQSATLQYTLEQAQDISVQLYDLQGHLLATYLDHAREESGEHALPVVLPDALPSGNYRLVLSSGASKVTIGIIK